MERELEFERETDFTDGAYIPESMVKEWHKKILDEIKKGHNSGWRQSGNSLVIANIKHFSHLDYKTVEVIEITKGYKISHYKLNEK
jgi:hypothetical protein